MKHLQLGKNGPMASAIGLGCMGMSDAYGPTDRGESLKTLAAAVDAGMNLIDTGDFYGMGRNELLIAEALKSLKRETLLLSVKFGAIRAPNGQWLGLDMRPKSVKNFLYYSLTRLGVDYVDIYRPARVDPQVPIEDTIGAIADMVKAGFVRYIGLSEVSSQTLRRAAAVHPICDLQIEYSLFSRGIEEEILPAARELGIGIAAYGVLSRGLLSGHWRKDTTSMSDFRSHSPRFQGSNADSNLALVEALREVATARHLTVAQAAIAWVAAQGSDVIPLVGARRRESLSEALGALEIVLSADDLAAIEVAVPKGAAAGLRYPAPAMAELDSEKAGDRPA